MVEILGDRGDGRRWEEMGAKASFPVVKKAGLEWKTARKARYSEGWCRWLGNERRVEERQDNGRFFESD
jgi:hypothetical protein